jgi:hypothetical protein
MSRELASQKVCLHARSRGVRHRGREKYLMGRRDLVVEDAGMTTRINVDWIVSLNIVD